MNDTISRREAIDALNALEEDGHVYVNGAFFETIPKDEAERVLEELPSAQPEIIRCKECKHFHYDMPYVIQGVPVLGHEVCDFWGDGCKTSENGFCSFAERRTDEAD